MLKRLEKRNQADGSFSIPQITRNTTMATIGHSSRGSADWLRFPVVCPHSLRGMHATHWKGRNW